MYTGGTVTSNYTIRFLKIIDLDKWHVRHPITLADITEVSENNMGVCTDAADLSDSSHDLLFRDVTFCSQSKENKSAISFLPADDCCFWTKYFL